MSIPTRQREAAEGPAPRGTDRAAGLHVLHVCQPVEGGVGRYVRDTCLDQLARGWRVNLACPAGTLSRDLVAAGVRWRSWPATRSPGPATLAETLALRRIIDSVGADVVHLHSSKAGLAGRLAVRARLPTLFQPHGWSWLAATGRTGRLALRWERLAARWTTTVVCVGDGERAAGDDAGVTAPTRVVRNGVDRRRFPAPEPGARAEARATLGLRDDQPLVVCPGRLTRQKGQDVLLAAWPAVRERCPTAVLALVGDGDLAADLLRDAPAGIRFVPPTPDVRAWLLAADVVALPSRWEGLPLTALEAAATGRSTVGSDINGLREVVVTGTGRLVTPDDPDALARALIERLSYPGTAAAEGARALELVERFDQRHTLDTLARLTVDLVGTVSSRDGRR